MYELVIRNEKGEELSLTKNKNYTVTKITGLTAAGCTINTSPVSGQDGERFNSSRINKRNIVITILPEDPVDANRVNLYRFFSEKGNIRIFFKTRIRDVYIDGRVETLDGDLFSIREEIQVSVLCPDPFFIKCGEGASRICHTPVIPLLEFPYDGPSEGMAMSELLSEDLQFENTGNVSVGALFHAETQRETSRFCIYDRQADIYMGIEYPIEPYDNLYFNTRKGEKGIWLTRNGEKHNLLRRRISGSGWIQIMPGFNTFEIRSDNTEYLLEIEWMELYEGV